MAWDVAVVDGAAATRRHLELALAAAGHRVVGWADAQTARRELVTPPRLLVSELLMEGMDGFDLLSWARAQWGPDVALVATTGLAWGQVNLAQVVRERFGAHFLRKPYLRSEAVELVGKAIGPPPAPGQDRQGRPALHHRRPWPWSRSSGARGPRARRPPR
jgi:DNA-binding NtrC family response regulator